MIIYRMILEVPETKVTTVFDLMRGEGVRVIIEPLEERKSRRRHHSIKDVDGNRVTSKMLVDKFLSKGPAWLKEIENELEKGGHNPKNASPRLSDLRKSGRVVQLDDGKWKRT